MGKLIDLAGQQFGRLTVLERAKKEQSVGPCWSCKCDCATEIIVEGSRLRSGNTKSCGCLKKNGNNLKHGHSRIGQKSKIYHTWRRIIDRCTRDQHEHYHYYGGRGIKVCEYWMKFENFLADMGEPPSKNHSIDRIDNDGDYCKSNCRWATHKEQCRNRGTNRLIAFDGKIKCIAEWAEELNINQDTIGYRINNGWTIKEALTTPVGDR